MKSGSDWIKCDLHIHSPASFFHCYGDRNDPAVWEKFLKDLEALPRDFRIIGINDYLTIEGYKRVIAEKKKGRLASIECILPVIEFRLNRLVGEGKTRRLNYHVIFSDSVTPEMIQQQFLNALSATYQLEAGGKHPDWSAILTEDSLKALGQCIKAQSPTIISLQAKTDLDVGFDNFNVDYAELQKILAFTCFKDRVITAIGKTEWEDYRWDGGGAADKRTIINQTDIVFVAAESVERYEASRQSLKGDNVNTRLLDCSDAHHFSDSAEKDRIGNCYTWIKAEPTLDGLRQILFEPDDRISVGESHPDKKAPYQVIEHVRFVGGGDRFGNQEIGLSPYLTSIIGGKSTGKSLLAGLIVKSTDIQEYRRRSQQSTGDVVDRLAWLEKELPTMNFEVVWRDGTTTTLQNAEQKTRKVTYFPQHHLNSSINDQGVGNKELNKIIRAVLAQKDLYAQAFDAYRAKVGSLNEDVAAATTSFEETLKDVRDARLRSAEKGKSADIRANVAKLEAESTGLQRQFDLTEDEIMLHTQLTSERAGLNAQKEAVSADIDVLDTVTADFLAERLSAAAVLPELLESGSDALAAAVRQAVVPLIASFQTAILDALKSIKAAHAARLEALESPIAAATERLQPILEKIAKSVPLRELAVLIETEKEKLAVVLALEAEIARLEGKITGLSAELNAFVEKRLGLAADVTAVMNEHPIEKGDDLLKVDIRPFVKGKHVQATLGERVRYQSNAGIRSIVQEPNLEDADFDTYRRAISTVVQQAIAALLEFKGAYKLGGLLQELLGNAMYLNYDLKLGGDSFTIMSPGKRALALLRIIIELDISEHPIILDQPEDDLDNRSIYDGLATYLKTKKLRRQIVVVTHNPNVVVGADSEYVIVANQSGQGSNLDNERYRFEYVYGGLERSFFDPKTQWILRKQGIREHVCQILDGGKGAFQRREQLYSTLKEPT